MLEEVRKAGLRSKGWPGGTARATTHTGVKRRHAEAFQALGAAEKFDLVPFVTAGGTRDLRRNHHQNTSGALYGVRSAMWLR